MSDEIEKYFSSEGIKNFIQVSNEEFAQFIRNPNTRADNRIERINENSFCIKNFTLDNEFIIFDSSASSSWSITFENCYFQNDVFFDDVIFKNHINFIECHFDNNVLFNNCQFQNLEFQNCYFKKKVRFNLGTFKDILFSQHDTKELTISRSLFNRFQIGYYSGSYKLNKLVIINNNRENGPIEIKGIKEINELLIYGAIYGNLMIEDLKCNLIRIHDVTNHGDMKFVNIQPINSKVSSFNINNSNLNNTEFYRLSLNKFTEVNITDSNLLNCVFINSEWPKIISAYQKPNIGNDKRIDDIESSSNNFKKNQKETYKQLKLILAKQGDTIQEQVFYTLEMDLYRNLINCNNPKKKEFWDKLILYFSALFSNYGTNFGKALLWFSLINFTFFSILICFFRIENLSFSIEHANWEAFNFAVKLFIKHLNPLHEFNYQLHWIVLIVDFIVRIFSSYLIYHLIRTSRRFVR
jgi:hypothetical protein